MHAQAFTAARDADDAHGASADGLSGLPPTQISNRERPFEEWVFTVHYDGWSGGDEVISVATGRLRLASEVDHEARLRVERVSTLSPKVRKVLKLLAKHQLKNMAASIAPHVSLDELLVDARKDTSVKRKLSTIKPLTREELGDAVAELARLDLAKVFVRLGTGGPDLFECLLMPSAMSQLAAGVRVSLPKMGQAAKVSKSEAVEMASEVEVEVDVEVEEEEDDEEAAVEWQTEGHEWLQRRVRPIALYDGR